MRWLWSLHNLSKPYSKYGDEALVIMPWPQHRSQQGGLHCVSRTTLSMTSLSLYNKLGTEHDLHLLQQLVQTSSRWSFQNKPLRFPDSVVCVLAHLKGDEGFLDYRNCWHLQGHLAKRAFNANLKFLWFWFKKWFLGISLAANQWKDVDIIKISKYSDPTSSVYYTLT